MTPLIVHTAIQDNVQLQTELNACIDAATFIPLTLDIQYTDQLFNNRFLQQLDQPTLLFDAQGLWLALSGLKIQADWLGEVPRLRRANIKNELIARACQLEKKPHILDATAGLGHDALLMAWLGASVHLVERHPLVFLLLKHTWLRTQQVCLQNNWQRLYDSLQRMTLTCADAIHVMTDLDSQTSPLPHIIYLDPMFPSTTATHSTVQNSGDMPLDMTDIKKEKREKKEEKKEKKEKKALVKKEMQVLQHLHHGMDLGEALLTTAQHYFGQAHIVVKRPAHAAPLAQRAPSVQFLGDTCRFDRYDYITHKVQ